MKKILLLLSLAYGCSSKPIVLLPSPSPERMEAIRGSIAGEIKPLGVLEASEELAMNYSKALSFEKNGKHKSACDLFEDLAENPAFPLNQTALVHTLSICQYSSSKLKKIWQSTVIAPYLKESYLDSFLTQAQKTKLQEEVADSSYELVAYKQVRSEKVKLLQKALSIAKNLGLKEKEEKYYKKLTEVSPSELQAISPQNIYSIAKDYESNRQFDKARDLYLQMINGDYPFEEQVKAYNAYRTSYKVGRDLKMFLTKTGEMENFLMKNLEANPLDAKAQEAWVEAKLNHARAVWTEHDNVKAREILEEVLLRKIGTQNQLATLYWIYGSLHIESKEILEGLKKYEKAATFTVTTLGLEENIQWALVWNHYQLKNDTEVVSFAERFVKKSINPDFFQKLNFWKAKALMRLEKLDEAKKVFESITERDPFSYYGLISTMETQTPLSPLASNIIPTESSGDLFFDWLIAVDEKVFATKFLKEIDSQFKSSAQREKAMSLYLQAGWYQGAMRQITNFPLKSRPELTKKYIGVVFPTPNEEIVNRFAQKYAVPAPLIYAITRQESTFNPNIRSWADAFGLMQLIPEKAKDLSAKHRIAYKQFEELYKPELNIELGTAFLSDLREKFNGKFVQSVAGYNASTSAIAVWEKERFNGDYLEFIEMIPYEETRNYVKLVFRNYMTYKRILEKADVVIPKDFFEVPFL